MKEKNLSVHSCDSTDDRGPPHKRLLGHPQPLGIPRALKQPPRTLDQPGPTKQTHHAPKPPPHNPPSVDAKQLLDGLLLGPAASNHKVAVLSNRLHFQMPRRNLLCDCPVGNVKNVIGNTIKLITSKVRDKTDPQIIAAKSTTRIQVRYRDAKYSRQP